MSTPTPTTSEDLHISTRLTSPMPPSERRDKLEERAARNKESQEDMKRQWMTMSPRTVARAFELKIGVVELHKEEVEIEKELLRVAYEEEHLDLTTYRKKNSEIIMCIIYLGDLLFRIRRKRRALLLAQCEASLCDLENEGVVGRSDDDVLKFSDR